MKKLPTYKELANYLKVSESAVKQYDKKKRELMLIGLKFKKLQGAKPPVNPQSEIFKDY